MKQIDLPLYKFYLIEGMTQEDLNELALERNNLSEEVYRLNNVINEFESWLISWIENEQYCFMSDNPKDRCRKEVYEEVLHHFKELKGIDKE